MISFVDQATVQFTNLSDADIDAYVESGEPMDKAGSYGIQGIGGQLVSSVQGDFFTVSTTNINGHCCSLLPWRGSLYGLSLSWTSKYR